MNAVQEAAPRAEVKNRVSSVVTEIAPDQQARMRELKSFKFKHSLGKFPALSIPNVAKLTQRLLDEKRFEQVFCSMGDKSGYSDKESAGKVLDALQSLDTAGAWLRLTRVDEINEEFRDICETFYGDLSKLLNRDIKSEVMKTFVTLFISSPNKITPYHIDHTWNFLLQIDGNKTVHLYDEKDQRVLSPEIQEGWYMQQCKVEENKAVAGIAYDLAPGEAAHHPVNAPHWVQNGPDVSVSLSFGLCLHSSNDDAKVHQINYLLRRMGMNPTPPRKSKWKDSVKIRTVKLLSKRKQNSMEDVVFSGMKPLHKVHRVLKMAKIAK
jgi:hypothetical protein